MFANAIEKLCQESLHRVPTPNLKIARVSELDEENGTYALSAYLIAQLGRNFTSGANERIIGEQLVTIDSSGYH